MRRFNAPPGWPPPPNVRWRPPKGWVPLEAWPTAPPGWAFWVNEHGRRVAGPIGRYGGPSRGWAVAGAGVLLAIALLGSGVGRGGGDPVATGSSPGAADTPFPTATGTTTGPATSSPTPTPVRTPVPTSATPVPPQTTTPVPVETTTRPRSVPTTSEPTSRRPAPPRNAGAAPLHRGDPGYSTRLDRDGDGVACGRD